MNDTRPARISMIVDGSEMNARYYHFAEGKVFIFSQRSNNEYFWIRVHISSHFQYSCHQINSCYEILSHLTAHILFTDIMCPGSLQINSPMCRMLFWGLSSLYSCGQNLWQHQTLKNKIIRNSNKFNCEKQSISVFQHLDLNVRTR